MHDLTPGRSAGPLGWFASGSRSNCTLLAASAALATILSASSGRAQSFIAYGSPGIDCPGSNGETIRVGIDGNDDGVLSSGPPDQVFSEEDFCDSAAGSIKHLVLIDRLGPTAICNGEDTIRISHGLDNSRTDGVLTASEVIGWYDVCAGSCPSTPGTRGDAG